MMTAPDTQTAAAATLSALQRETLRLVAGHIVPASAEFDVPGADDPAIFSEIVSSIARDRAAILQALDEINRRAGGRLDSLPPNGREKCLAEFRAASPMLAGAVEAAVARCYYRDDRVLASIGMEARPAFPLGYALEQGDWSLLEPVRARGKVYRDAE
jgi:hypothetical protein